MRVAMVTPRYMPETGGVERHVDEVSRRLVRRGVDVTVITTDRSGKLPPVEERDGVTVKRVRASPSRRDWYWAPSIPSVIRDLKPHVVHVQSYHTFVAPLAMAGALRAEAPFILTFHGGGHSSLHRRRLRGVQLTALRPLLARAGRLVATARFELELYSGLLGLPRDRFVLIPNGGDLPRMPRASASPVLPLIASVGRLERYKGHHRVLAALPKVLEQRPDVRLWIAGSGPYEAELWKLSSRLGVRERVKIEAVPLARADEMASRLQGVGLVVLLSEFETHPMALLEAAALGRPLLVARTSGLTELVDRGVAVGVALDSDPDTVAAAMLQQLERPIAATEVELPTWDDCADQLHALYSEVARGRRRVA